MYSQKKINLNCPRVICWFSILYSGKFWYFSNSVCHALSEIGGMMPEMGCHSTMERPELVRRVIPPIITMKKMRRQAERSQAVIWCLVFAFIVQEFYLEKLPRKSLWSEQSISLDFIHVWQSDQIIHHSSGVYFVKMIAGDNIRTQKLILLK